MTCCNNGCLTYEQMLQYFETYIANALLCGKLQGGLHACDSDTNLSTGTTVVTCAQLKDKLNELLESGELNVPGIESLTLDGTRIELVDQAGKTHSIDLSGLLDRTVENFIMTASHDLKLTLKDGTTFDIPLADYLKDLVADASIKSGMLDKDGNLVLNLGNGETVTVALSEFLKTLADGSSISGGILDQDGNLVFTRGDGTTIKVNMDSLKKIYIDRDSPLTGDGSQGDPLSIDFSRVCWQVIESIHFTENGLEIKIDNQCDPVILPLDEILNILNSRVKVCVNETQGIITGNGAEGTCLAIDLDELVSHLAGNDTLITNLALGLNYKVKVAVTQGVKGDGTTNNPLNVNLSPDNGNLLVLRDNGLYYGTQAAADVTDLYVDPVAGDNSNPGTRVLPLQTLDAAIAKVKSNQSNTIHLRAGQTFYFKNSFNIDGGATRQFTPYGDPYIDGAMVPNDVGTPSVPFYYGWSYAECNRPIIKPWVIYSESNHIIYCSTMNPSNGGKLLLEGCILDAKPINDVDTGHESIPASYDSTWGRYNGAMIYGNAAGTVELRCCILRVPVCPENTYLHVQNPGTALADLMWWSVIGSAADGSIASVQLTRSHWETGGSNVLLNMSGASAQLYVTAWPGQGAGMDGRTGYTPLEENLSTRLKESKAIYGITRDSDGKPRNISSNVVL